MKKHLKEISTAYSRFSGLTMLFGVAGLAGIVALLVLSLANEYHEAEHNAQVEVENISRVLEEHALATVQKADLLLREVQRNVHPADMQLDRGASSSRKQELHALLKSQLEGVPEVAVLHVTNAIGNHIYSSLDPVPNINIADRYHFTRHRDDAAAALVISPPLISRTTGKWTLILTRRINFKDGSFAGIGNVILNLQYFQQFYSSLNLGKHGLVAMYDKELHLAARYPSSEKDMGNISNIYAKTYIEKGIKQATYHATSPLDGVKRLTSFRQVGKLPLFVFAGIAEDEYLADWHRHIWQYSVGAVIFSLVVLGFGWWQRRAQEGLRKNELRFRYMLETSPIAVRIASLAGGKVLFANQRYIELIESQQDQVIGAVPKDYYAHPQDYKNALQILSLGERVTNKLVELRIPGGKSKWTLASYLNVEYGNEPAVLGWFYDITERRHAEEELRIAAIAFEAQEGMMVTDANKVIMRVNHAFTEITGYTAQEAVGQTPQLLKSGRHDADFYAVMWESIQHNGSWQGEIWSRRKNAEVYPEQLTITAVKGDAGEVTHYVATLHDITLRKTAEEIIHNLAFYDALTQLPNRRLLNDRLGQAMAASKRSGRYGALMFLDLDNFKPLNDTYGHSVGDLLLIEVARRIRSCVRETDTVARFGGDEFVVMLSELDTDKGKSTAQASIIAEKIRVTLAEPYALTMQPVGDAKSTVEHHCTSSIGVELFINHAASPEDIIKRADMAMYQAKGSGRNQIRFYELKV